MTITTTSILVLWLVFLAYWAISAKGIKEDVYRENTWWRYVGIILVFLYVALPLPSYLRGPFVPQNPATNTIAVALCAVGIALAIWARRHLGANWSAFPALKKEHELVTSGPYRFVRHPIYTGILCAILGSVLIADVFWFVVLIFFGGVFAYRVKAEERIMMERFPETYPDYKKRTKALIPFVW